MSNKLTLSQNEITDLAAELKTCANDAYTLNEHGIYTTTIRGTEPSVKEFIFQGRLPPNAHEIFNNLAEVGLTEFFLHFAEDEQSTRIHTCRNEKGQQFIIRSAMNMLDGVKSRDRQNDGALITRKRHPSTLQPFKTWHITNRKRTELLPLVVMIDDNNTPERQRKRPYIHKTKALAEIMHYLAGEELSLKMDALKDTAILPNGGITKVDPGDVKLTKRNNERGGIHTEEEALSAVWKRQQAANLPPELCWLNAPNTWIQDQFFPNPFEPT